MQNICSNAWGHEREWIRECFKKLVCTGLGEIVQKSYYKTPDFNRGYKKTFKNKLSKKTKTETGAKDFVRKPTRS